MSAVIEGYQRDFKESIETWHIVLTLCEDLKSREFISIL